jgi:nucleotide-binding universal stress UspA family protein
MQHPDGSVVVGIDRSGADSAAVRLAGVEAALRGRPLDLLGAYRCRPDEVRRAAECTPQEVARRRLVETAAAVRMANPHLHVRTVLVAGELGGALIARSRGAGLVVVGVGGPPGVGQRVAAHAAAPVLVARTGYRPGGPVLLGVDGSCASPEAVGFAFDEAAMRGAVLLAVYAWPGVADVALSGVDPFDYDAREARTEADRVLAEALAGWSEKYPDVRVERRAVLAADPAGELMRQSADASMLVLAARSHIGASELLLGAVTRFALQHAHCPVAVLSHVRP